MTGSSAERAIAGAESGGRMRRRSSTRRARSFVTVMVLVAGATSVFGVAPASAAPAWTVAPSANPAGPPTGRFLADACAGTASCFAVGARVVGSSGSATYVQHWNGTGWAIQVSPNPAGATVSELDGVACAGPSTCFAVGFWNDGTGANAGPLVEAWNGTSWALVAAPTPAGARFAELSAVTCISATDCFAVGQSGDPTVALVEHWDGTAWTITPSPNPAGSTFSELLGVACASASVCFAVGAVATSTATSTLLEQWDGTSWAVVAAAAPSGAVTPVLLAVACASSTSCFAVGDDESSTTQPTFVDGWSGSTWSVAATPNPANAQLAAVTCQPASNCFAVGFASGVPLIERWNGTAWARASVPGAGDLRGVACASASRCFAVGAATNGVGLIERWDTTGWTVMAHPNAGVSNGSLNAVTCVASRPCFAVGNYESANNVRSTLIEKQSGTAWILTASPNGAASVDSELAGAACASATSCFAVGSQRASGHYTRILVEHWDGSAWTVVSVPQPGSLGAELKSVSCPSATSCFAAGFLEGGVPKTLVLHWDGTTWTVAATPNKSTDGDNELHAISCASPTSCFAVGVWQPGSLQSALTLIERWNGTTWTIITSPNSSAGSWNALHGVSCASATSCFAVGVVQDSGLTFSHSLVERWNGTLWAVVASANQASSTETVLDEVSCPTTTSCFAVGLSRPTTTSGRTTTVVEHSTGGAFTLQTSPNAAGSTDTRLGGVSCAGAATCAAVGSQGSSTPKTFAARYA